MNQTTTTGNKRWYIWLTLLASIITIVVFITGKNAPGFLQPTQKAEVSPTNQAGDLITQYFPLFVGSTRT
jgi:hypothetical protein